MGHMLHARAGTTPEVRREMQNSQESLMVLANHYGVNTNRIRFQVQLLNRISRNSVIFTRQRTTWRDCTGWASTI